MKKFLSDTTKRALRKTIITAIPEVLALCDPKEKDSGGYFRLYHYPEINGDYPSLVMLEHGRFGGMGNMEKNSRFEIYSFEKAIRLASNAPRGHMSSWESRDPPSRRWGGAVLLMAKIPDLGENYTPIILSFSGIDEELADEALSLLIADRMGWDISPALISKIVKTSTNHIASQFWGGQH